MMSLMLNPIQEPSAKPAILLPQSNADDFTPQGRTSGWERVNSKYQQGLGWGRITICLQI